MTGCKRHCDGEQSKVFDIEEPHKVIALSSSLAGPKGLGPFQGGECLMVSAEPVGPTEKLQTSVSSQCGPTFIYFCPCTQVTESDHVAFPKLPL